ncbi:MAG: DUF488 domain-containing protein [Saprospiraceae bacterium]|nr:DUF488 domain-containing protein [Saprospiraceae bacterium]
MYYRRKIILSLLALKDGAVSKIDLQKLLFIFTKYPNSTKVYDFVPYKYGCFSFQANADLGTMIKYNLVSSDDKSWSLNDNDTDYISQLKEDDRRTMKALIKHHGSKSTNELITFTYKNFPYWATKSTIAHKHLNAEELVKVEEHKTHSNIESLYTIGYEGISLESYLNKLIEYDIKLLIDVRKNAKSMKYGFSKKQLLNACNGISIEYRHMPEVGIESDKRTELNVQSDYDSLFEDYRDNTLTTTVPYQEQIGALVSEYKRVALTCFEENICQCHRKPLAESVVALSKSKLMLKHI